MSQRKQAYLIEIKTTFTEIGSNEKSKRKL